MTRWWLRQRIRLVRWILPASYHIVARSAVLRMASVVHAERGTFWRRVARRFLQHESWL